MSIDLFLPFTTRLLTSADIQLLIGLRETVLGSLSDPEIYRRESDEINFLARHLVTAGRTVGVFHDTSLVAYGILGLDPFDHRDQAHRQLDILPFSFDEKSATMQSAMVHPEYRGLGLQIHLLKFREKMAFSVGSKLIIALASLKNNFSRENLFRCGYIIVGMGNYRVIGARHIFAKYSNQRIIAIGNRDALDIASADDIDGQRTLFDDGYVAIPSGFAGPLQFMKRLHLTLERDGRV